MRKIMIISLVRIGICLVVLSTLLGCSSNQTSNSNNKVEYLTPQEMYTIECIFSENDVLYPYKDLNGFLNYKKESDKPSLITCHVEAISYYLGWTHIGEGKEYEKTVIDGYTKYILCIDSVNSLYNDLSLNVGDRVYVTDNSFIFFRNTNDSCSFFSDQMKTEIKGTNDLKELADCMFELKPEKGYEYRRYVYPETLPLEIGKEYSMALVERNSLLRFKFASPLPEDQTLEEIYKMYNMYEENSETYTIIAEEIKKSFLN